MKKKYLLLSKKQQNIIKVSVWSLFIICMIIYYATVSEETTVLQTVLSFLILFSLVSGITLIVWQKKPAAKLITQDITPTSKEEKKVDYKSLFPEFLDNHLLKWKYTTKLAFPQNLSAIKVGDSENLQLDEEQDNEYDKESIILLKDKTRLGYFYKGSIREMIIKYFFKSNQYKPAMIISQIDEEQEILEIAIAFYKYCDLENNTKIRKISANLVNKKSSEEYEDRQFALSDVSKGDILQIEEDSYCENGYLVYNNTHEEIGELNTKTAEILDEFIGSKSGYIVCTAEEIEENENDVVKGEINIYLVDKHF